MGKFAHLLRSRLADPESESLVSVLLLLLLEVPLLNPLGD